MTEQLHGAWLIAGVKPKHSLTFYLEMAVSYSSWRLSGSTNLNEEMTDINKAVMCFHSHHLVADAQNN